MKTYQEYEKNIKDRERKEYEKKHVGHNHSSMLCIGLSPSRTTLDISIEILTMAMKDFIEELRKLKV